MIAPITVDSVNFELDDDLKKYAIKKIGKVDRFTPRHVRNALRAEIKLIETTGKGKKQCTCDVVIHIPGEDLFVSETTVNMYAAIDIVEAKLKNQIKRYKDKHGTQAIHKRVIARLKRRDPKATAEF